MSRDAAALTPRSARFPSFPAPSPDIHLASLSWWGMLLAGSELTGVEEAVGQKGDTMHGPGDATEHELD